MHVCVCVCVCACVRACVCVCVCVCLRVRESERKSVIMNVGVSEPLSVLELSQFDIGVTGCYALIIEAPFLREIRIMGQNWIARNVKTWKMIIKRFLSPGPVALGCILNLKPNDTIIKHLN